VPVYEATPSPKYDESPYADPEPAAKVYVEPQTQEYDTYGDVLLDKMYNDKMPKVNPYGVNNGVHYSQKVEATPGTYY